MNRPQRVGIVGAGRMGANLGRRLNDVGFDVSAVFDERAEAATAIAAELGALAAPDPAAVASAADVVLTVVSDDAAMRAILAGDRGLLATARGKLFVNCATLTPSVHADAQAAAEAAGGAAIEACMAGSIPQARGGALFLMCGGKRETFDRVKPLLDAMATTVRYIGGAGRAAQVKVLVNMVMNINTAGLAEGLGLGDALGLDLDMLRDIFAHTGANSRVLETDGADMQAREHEAYFSAAHAAKDSGIALQLAHEAGLELPLAAAAASQYRRMVEVGLGELDKSGIAELTFPRRAAAKAAR